jgi:hypothetical protein
MGVNLVPELRSFAVIDFNFPENRPALPRPKDETLDVPMFFHFMEGSGGTPAFDSGPLAPGAPPFVVVFGSPGNFQFHCNFHPQMHGTVNVVAGE